MNNPVTLGIWSPDLARFYDEQDLSRIGPRRNLHVSALTAGLAALERFGLFPYRYRSHADLTPIFTHYDGELRGQPAFLQR